MAPTRQQFGRTSNPVIMCRLTVLAGSSLFLLSAQSLAAQSVNGLAWMSGCWERRTPTGATVEQWMSPEGGTMLGMSRTVRGDSTREWEFLRLAPIGSQLHYIAVPSGQRETAFAAVHTSDTLAIFENAAHDFPQRISYARASRDSLIARVGMLAAGGRVITISFRRATCGGSTP